MLTNEKVEQFRRPFAVVSFNYKYPNEKTRALETATAFCVVLKEKGHTRCVYMAIEESKNRLADNTEFDLLKTDMLAAVNRDFCGQFYEFIDAKEEMIRQYKLYRAAQKASYAVICRR